MSIGKYHTPYALLVKFLVNFVPEKHHRKMRDALINTSVSHILQIKKEYNESLINPPKTKHNVSIVLIVKDEAEYIEEWIEYYTLQGVDHFYIFNNNGTDNTDKVLAPYIREGLVTFEDYHGKDMQRTIYNYAVAKYKHETQWMGFFDIDEFVVPVENKTIAEFLDDFTHYSQILISWVIYGTSGHKNKEPGLVIERFTQHAAEPSKSVKAFVNPRSVLWADVHYHSCLGETVDPHTRPTYKKRRPSMDIIRCNHYILKSEEEFYFKRNKGRFSGRSTEVDDEYFNSNNQNDVTDNIMERFVAPIHQALEKRREEKRREEKRRYEIIIPLKKLSFREFFLFPHNLISLTYSHNNFC